MSESPATQPSSEWKKCNICKKPILFDTDYYVCSVSTCRHKITGFVFCSSLCYDGHLGFARHRSSYCEENRSPKKGN